MIDAKDSTSTRPYLIRALYEWCTDNGFTPYVAVLVDDSVRVPNEYVKDGEIVLNISFDATSSLKLGNEFIEFKARFAGTAREIMIPISHVIAIYARENGQGMAFPMSVPSGSRQAEPTAIQLIPVAGGHSSPEITVAADNKVLQFTSVQGDQDDKPTDPPRTPMGSRPALKRVK